MDALPLPRERVAGSCGSSHAGGLQEWARWGWCASRTYSAGMHDERQQVDAYRPHEATSEGCASWWRCGVWVARPRQRKSVTDNAINLQAARFHRQK